MPPLLTIDSPAFHVTMLRRDHGWWSQAGTEYRDRPLDEGFTGEYLK
jgi:hypothetical protein